MNSMPLEATNELFYLYALTLSVGETIQGKVVKSATISEYLTAAAKFVQVIGQRKDCPMTDPHTGKRSKKIDQHLKDFERWEAMPTRQDPLTKKMIRDLQEHAKDAHPDSKEAAFIDWCIVGLHMGYRRCEWASEKSPKNPDDVPRVSPMNDSIYQCTLDDFKLLGREGERISDPENYPPDKLGGSIHRVRWQKNGQHGQKVRQAANREDPSFCCVRAVQRIKQRAKRLGLQGHQPASAYRANRGSKKPSFFCVRTIQALIRDMAKRTYKCDDLQEADLRYTGHSIRIGACVLLYCGGAKDIEIQHRLRWRSMAFLDYLRDMPRTAINHMRIINAADVESWL
jgi:hypothetical protein